MVPISIVSSYLSSNKLHLMHLSSLSAGVGVGWAGLNLLLNFQKGRLDRVTVLRSQDLRKWLLGKIGVTFFSGVAVFTYK